MIAAELSLRILGLLSHKDLIHKVPQPRLPLSKEEKAECLGKLYFSKAEPQDCPRHSPGLGGGEGQPGAGGEGGGG